MHGLSHRAVDRTAGFPTGTTSNYFRSRDALLEAAAQHVASTHETEMTQAHEGVVAHIDTVTLVELLAQSLHDAATLHRKRYLAVYILMLEANRLPQLHQTLRQLEQAMATVTAGEHGRLGLDISHTQMSTLIQLYTGALFTLVAGPPGHVDRTIPRNLAASMVAGIDAVEHRAGLPNTESTTGPGS